MDTERLKEYLGIVVEMEKNLFMMERLNEEWRTQADALGHPQDIPKPTRIIRNLITIDNANRFKSLKVWGDPPKIERRRPRDSTSYVLLSGIMGGAVFFTIPILIVLLGIVHYYDHPFIISLCLAAFLGVIYFLWLRSKEDKIFNKEKQIIEQEYAEKKQLAEQECEAEYQSKMAEYHRQCEADALRVSQENMVKTMLEQQINDLTQRYNASKERLAEIYAYNIIFPKYRNLIMVCSLYEYICAGRCAQLEGSDGGYNILETEIRLDRIITNMDSIIEKLDDIKQGQFALHRAIRESNRRLEEIASSNDQMIEQIYSLSSKADIHSDEFQTQLTELQRSSEASVYCAERTQKELEYMNRMDYLTGRNNGVLFNRPPNY